MATTLICIQYYSGTFILTNQKFRVKLFVISRNLKSKSQYTTQLRLRKSASSDSACGICYKTTSTQGSLSRVTSTEISTISIQLLSAYYIPVCQFYRWSIWKSSLSLFCYSLVLILVKGIYMKASTCVAMLLVLKGNSSKPILKLYCFIYVLHLRPLPLDREPDVVDAGSTGTTRNLWIPRSNRRC